MHHNFSEPVQPRQDLRPIPKRPVIINENQQQDKSAKTTPLAFYHKYEN